MFRHQLFMLIIMSALAVSVNAQPPTNGPLDQRSRSNPRSIDLRTHFDSARQRVAQADFKSAAASLRKASGLVRIEAQRVVASEGGGLAALADRIDAIAADVENGNVLSVDRFDEVTKEVRDALDGDITPSIKTKGGAIGSEMENKRGIDSPNTSGSVGTTP